MQAPTFGAAVLTPAQAQKIATDAYIYGYSLVTTEITRMAFTNVTEPDVKTLQAPINQFVNQPLYPPASYRGVSAPNADTLYSAAFIDVRKEPMVFSYPNMGKRYFLFPMYSEWMVSLGSPGTRTLGDAARTILITGPGWTGSVPAGMKHVESPTGYMLILGRVYSDGSAADLAQVHSLQKAFKLVPLSSYGKTYTPPQGQTGGPYQPSQKVRDIIDAMSTSQYFKFMATAMKANPPVLPEDAPMVAQMAKIGLVAGQPFDMSKLDPAVQAALVKINPKAMAQISAMQKKGGKIFNGWLVPGSAGVYGTNFLQRAYIAAYGWPANVPEDADYPNTKVDSTGAPLLGIHTYRVHFTKGQTPPVNGFWSITMYDNQYFFYPNPLNKLTVSMRNHPVFNSDGSLDLYFSNKQPPKVPQANWLPAPASDFILMMRLYWPKETPPSILPPSNPSWLPPMVKKVN